MKLYYSEGACSLSPHIVLNELNLPHEAIKVSMDKGENLTPEYLKLNPLGAVPVLVMDDGQPLTEGVAIIQYLADMKPEMGLAPPNGSLARVRLQETLNFISTELHKGIGALFGVKYFTTDAHVQEVLKKGFIDGVSEKLDFFNQKMTGKTFLMGNQFTVADAYFFTVFNWCNYLGLKQDAWPNLKAISDRIAARPAVRKTLEKEDLL